MYFERDPNNLNGDIINSAKEELDLFYEEKVKGFIIRARVRWHEHGEKSTKYFLNLEKRNHIKNHIRLDTQQPASVFKTLLSRQQQHFIHSCTSLNTYK